MREIREISKRPRKSFSPPGSCAAMFFRVSLDGLSERGDYSQSSCVVMLKRFLLENSWKEKVIITVESWFYEPPRETKNGSKNRRVREIGGRGKRLLVRVIGWFEKSRVPEIGIPLYKNFTTIYYLFSLVFYVGEIMDTKWTCRGTLWFKLWTSFTGSGYNENNPL